MSDQPPARKRRWGRPGEARHDPEPHHVLRIVRPGEAKPEQPEVEPQTPEEKTEE